VHATTTGHSDTTSAGAGGAVEPLRTFRAKWGAWRGLARAQAALRDAAGGARRAIEAKLHDLNSGQAWQMWGAFAGRPDALDWSGSSRVGNHRNVVRSQQGLPGMVEFVAAVVGGPEGSHAPYLEWTVDAFTVAAAFGAVEEPGGGGGGGGGDGAVATAAQAKQAKQAGEKAREDSFRSQLQLAQALEKTLHSVSNTEEKLHQVRAVGESR
jgi:hypothetical protein